MAQITKPWQRFGQRPLHVASIDVLNERIPDRTPLLFPMGILFLQPDPLGFRYACLRFPPHSGTPEPDAQMQRVVPGLQTSEKPLPVPRLLEALVLNPAHDLAPDPSLPNFFLPLL